MMKVLFKSRTLFAAIALAVAVAGLLGVQLLAGGGPPEAGAQACSSLTIAKVTNPTPDLSNTQFPFTSVDTSPPATIAPFNLLDQTSLTHNFTASDDCYNEVTETVPFGWSLTNIVCTGGVASAISIVGSIAGTPGAFEPGDDSVHIDVAAGENVTCTFTNTMIVHGSITICKQTDPAGGTGFTFPWSSPTIHPIPFMLDDGQCFTASGLDPANGPYTFSEVPPAGWQITFIACAGGSNIMIGTDNDYDPGDTSVIINLNPGEQVICTFVNNPTATRLWGDVDCDGDVDVVDALAGLRYTGGLNVVQTEPCPGMGAAVRVSEVLARGAEGR